MSAIEGRNRQEVDNGQVGTEKCQEEQQSRNTDRCLGTCIANNAAELKEIIEANSSGPQLVPGTLDVPRPKTDEPASADNAEPGQKESGS